MLSKSRKVVDGDTINLSPDAEVNVEAVKQGAACIVYLHAVYPEDSEEREFQVEVVEASNGPIEATPEATYTTLVHGVRFRFYRISLIEATD